MGLTTDPNDPGLNSVDPITGLQTKYLVLSEIEKARGFVRPVRLSYFHGKCESITSMSRGIAETYAAQPHYYGSTYCSGCSGHYPVGPDGDFFWVENDVVTDIRVGT